jgi:hypothetical protein
MILLLKINKLIVDNLVIIDKIILMWKVIKIVLDKDKIKLKVLNHKYNNLENISPSYKYKLLDKLPLFDIILIAKLSICSNKKPISREYNFISLKPLN